MAMNVKEGRGKVHEGSLYQRLLLTGAQTELALGLLLESKRERTVAFQSLLGGLF